MYYSSSRAYSDSKKIGQSMKHCQHFDLVQGLEVYQFSFAGECYARYSRSDLGPDMSDGLTRH